MGGGGGKKKQIGISANSIGHLFTSRIFPNWDFLSTGVISLVAAAAAAVVRRIATHTVFA